jgi:MATE family multidrug resistance protein
MSLTVSEDAPATTSAADRLEPLDEPSGWWSRPCGGRDVLQIALPLVISTMSWTIMNFVDRMMLLWHSQEEMAAAAPAGLLLFTWISFPLGIASYANTFVAQYDGSNNRHRVGVTVWQAVLLASIVTPFFFLTLPIADAIFRFGDHPAIVRAYEMAYYRVLCLGAGGTIASTALATFFTGRAQTRVVMVVDGIAALANIALDYVLIFGALGFPEMGIEGAAWATTLCQWGKTAVYFYLMMRPRYESVYRVRAGMRFDGRLFLRLLTFGGPEGLRMVVEMSALTGFLIILGRLGESALAATTLAFNINGVGFIPLIGMGIAVSTLVGQQLGRGRPDLASRATFTALWISIGYTVFMAILYLGFPHVLMSGHAAGSTASEFEELMHTTTILLRFVAIYCLMDACYIIFLGAIKGAGDTRFVMIATILLSPIPVLATWFGMQTLGWGLIGCWTVLTIWVTLNGLIYALRFYQGRWQSMRVIESELQ